MIHNSFTGAVPCAGPKIMFDILLIIACALSSCSDSIGINQTEESKFVIFAFPTVSDTIPITVSLTRPIGQAVLTINGIKVSCTVNGKEDEIILSDSTNVSGLPVLTYYAIGKHKAGDNVNITVSPLPVGEGTGVGSVSCFGSTTIPPLPTLDSVRLDTTFHKEDYYTDARISFHKIDGVSYYATRLQGMDYFSDSDSTSYEYKEVETSMEPLLNDLTDAELGFGTKNDFYHQMYVFDPSSVKSNTVTVHLNTVQQMYTRAYRVELYSLTPEYYFMMKSINDIKNNEMGEHGLAFIRPTYTNIQGGYGCVAGYGCVKSQWLK